MLYNFEFGAEDTTGKGFPLLKGEVTDHLLTLARNTSDGGEILSSFSLTDSQVANFERIQRADPNFLEVELALSMYQANIWFNDLLPSLQDVVEASKVFDRTDLLRIVSPLTLQDPSD